MAKQTINIGTSANDGTGSTLRAAFDICNDNFTELYDGTGGLLHKIEGTNFTGSLLVGHSTTGTLDNAFYNTALGIGALDALTTGDYNIAIGYNAGTLLATGGSNTLIGALAGDSLTGGDGNVAIGKSAMGSADGTESNNVAIGFSALSAMNNNASNYNTAVGYNAGASITTGLENTIIGGKSLDALTTGHLNVAVGYESLSTEDTGSRNTAVGWRALKDLNYDGLGYNAAFGMSAGENISTGVQNTLIGSLAADSLTTGSNNIVLGYNAEASAVDVSNEVTIGNSSIANVRIPADSTLKIGASGDLQLEHLSSNSFIKNTAVGDLYIENQVDDKDVIFRSDDGSGGLATYFYLDGSGTRTIFEKLTRYNDSVNANFGTDSDLRIYHDSSNSYIEQSTSATGDLIIQQKVDDKDIIFKCDDGSGGTTAYLTLDGSLTQMWADKDLQFSDSIKAKFGASSDLQIYHNGTNSYMSNSTGDFYIEQLKDDGDIIFKSDDGSGGTATYFYLDGGNTRVQFNKDARFVDDIAVLFGSGGDSFIKHTGSQMSMFNDVGNIVITNRADDSDIIFSSDDGSGGTAEYFRLDGGDTNVLFSKILKLSDNVELRIGGGNDIKIYHDTSNSYIKTGTEAGNLIIEQNTDDADIIFKSDDGSGGVTEYFRLDGGEKQTIFSEEGVFADSKRLMFGAGGDLQIQHDGSNSYIDDAGTGDLRVRTIGGAAVKLQFGDENMVVASANSSVELYYDNSKKFETTSTGVTVTGDVNLGDSSYLYIGASNDLQLIHDGTDSYIQNTQNSGDLVIQNGGNDKDVIFKCDDGSGGQTAYITLDGSDVSTVVNTIKVLMPNLPTSDPSVAGQLYTDSGVLKVSAG